MAEVVLKVKSGRQPAVRAFYDLLVGIAQVWPLLDQQEQTVCAKAIRGSFAPFFHEQLVSNLREALHELIEAERAATAAEPATILKFHADRSGRLTIATREKVPRSDLAERVARET
jgi:hypothetical protein